MPLHEIDYITRASQSYGFLVGMCVNGRQVTVGNAGADEATAQLPTGQSRGRSGFSFCGGFQ